AELDYILDVYDTDNCSTWDMQPDGKYQRRQPAEGEAPRAAQQIFMIHTTAQAETEAENVETPL
ncbi:MAG: hypothetical protein HOH74_28735, partial [Gemmatimonadetes bacterium]|nr:hypothetical protein [Gemmatimonadota bacterium]